MSEYSLSYESLIGRDHTQKDMIINKKLKFDSIEKCNDWVQKTLNPILFGGFLIPLPKKKI